MALLSKGNRCRKASDAGTDHKDVKWLDRVGHSKKRSGLRYIPFEIPDVRFIVIRCLLLVPDLEITDSYIRVAEG